jgi:MOSC domain-containing protein YiiM
MLVSTCATTVLALTSLGAHNLFMDEVKHLSIAELEAGLEHIRQSPRDHGIVRMIVRRPSVNEREVLSEAQLDPVVGLVGDNWRMKGSDSTIDGSAHPDKQLTIMNARVIALVAQEKQRWPLAGDQLYVDMDLSAENLPPGSLLAIGTAVVEVTAPPHTGCHKFKSRFGRDAMQFVNWSKDLHFRGINAKVVQAGEIRLGDVIRKR